MTANPDPARLTLQNALAALKRGDRATARRLAEQAAELVPESEAPWLLLAALSPPEESLFYAQRALEINPTSPAAEKAVQWAIDRIQKPWLEDQTAQPAEQPPSPPASPARSAEQPPPEPARPADFPGPSFGSAEPEPPEPTAEPAPEAEPELEEFSAYEADLLPEEQPEPEVWVEAGPAVRPAPAAPAAKTPLRGAQIFLLTLLGLIALILIGGALMLRPQIGDLLAALSPGNDCQAALSLGAQNFEIRTLAPKKDGSFEIPDSHPERLYWLKGTDVNLVFVMLPTEANVRLVSSVQDGQTAALTWPNCTTTAYRLSPVSAEKPFNLSELEECGACITVFIPGLSARSGFFLSGSLVMAALPAPAQTEVAPPPGETLVPLTTAEAGALQLEITLLDPVSGGDPGLLAAGVAILNTGQTPAALTAAEVWLEAADGSRIPVSASQPTLPLELSPGMSQTFYFSFARPSGGAPTLHVFDVAYDLEGY